MLLVRHAELFLASLRAWLLHSGQDFVDKGSLLSETGRREEVVQDPKDGETHGESDDECEIVQTNPTSKGWVSGAVDCSDETG